MSVHEASFRRPDGIIFCPFKLPLYLINVSLPPSLLSRAREALIRGPMCLWICPSVPSFPFYFASPPPPDAPCPGPVVLFSSYVVCRGVCVPLFWFECLFVSVAVLFPRQRLPPDVRSTSAAPPPSHTTSRTPTDRPTDPTGQDARGGKT